MGHSNSLSRHCSDCVRRGCVFAYTSNMSSSSSSFCGDCVFNDKNRTRAKIMEFMCVCVSRWSFLHHWMHFKHLIVPKYNVHKILIRIYSSHTLTMMNAHKATSVSLLPLIVSHNAHTHTLITNFYRCVQQMRRTVGERMEDDIKLLVNIWLLLWFLWFAVDSFDRSMFSEWSRSCVYAYYAVRFCSMFIFIWFFSLLLWRRIVTAILSTYGQVSNPIWKRTV